jgi:transketolase
MLRPDRSTILSADTSSIPASLRRITEAENHGKRYWIGNDDAVTLSKEDQHAYTLAHQILMRLCIDTPLLHKSGHPGGPLSAFTACYEVMRRRDPSIDEPLRMSPGHLSLLGFLLQWLFGRNGDHPCLQSPTTIHETFRTPNGLPGHIEAGIGDIPFGTGPLGKGVSNALGVAFAKKYLKKKGLVDVLLADGDSQEGQVMEAMRLAPALGIDNLVVHGDWNDMQLSGIPSKTVACDFASMVQAMGWTVIEVEQGNDPAQVRRANDLADTLLGKGSPIFICYYTTMGYGVPLIEEGSNALTKNFHGAPLSADEAKMASESINLPLLSKLETDYFPTHDAHRRRFKEARSLRASAILPFDLSSDYERSLTTKEGAARKDFGAVHLKSLMAHDERIVVLHADLADSGGFGAVEKAFPDRVINVGVAEANMYMMAAGMRQGGLLPVTYTFAAFGMNEARASARLIDINTGHIPLGVLHDCTHSGLSVGEDGETHQERNYTNIPFDHTQVWVCGDSNQAAAMAERALQVIAQGTESVYVFSSRSNHPQLLTEDGSPFYDASYVFDGRASMVRGFGDLRDEATILAYGATLPAALEAFDLLKEDGRAVRVLNMACLRPMDASAVIKAAFETQHLIVVEDHNTDGGLATQVADLIADLALPCTLRRMGVRHYFPSAPADTLMLLAGLDAESIATTVQDQFAYRLAGGEEALVACLYALSDRLQHTKFFVSAQEYCMSLLASPDAIDALRQLWKSRAFDVKNLPSTTELLARLSAHPIDPAFYNSLTGTLRHDQHDSGVL